MRILNRTLAFASVPFLLHAAVVATTARAAEEPNVANYKCSEFLEDAMLPKDGLKLLRSMMVVTWATGYAAAYEKDNARADPKAIRQIAGTLAAICSKAPNDNAVEAFVKEVHAVFNGSN